MKARVRNSAWALQTIILLSGSLASPANGQQAIHEARAATSDGTVKITNAAGSVRVRGWGRDSVAVTGSLGAGSEGVEFSVSGREARIRVILPQGSSEDLGNTDLVVHVPRESHVAVRAAAADIDVDSVFGVVDVESVSGRVRVGGSPRMVYAQSSGGDVDIEAAGKVARAKSVEGTVRVHNARGYVEISTISGDAILEGREVWEGEVTTVSGRIRFDGSFASNGSFYFESHSGDIELSLSAGSDPSFEIMSFSGNVSDSVTDASVTRSTGGLVKIKTFKGSIRIGRL